MLNFSHAAKAWHIVVAVAVLAKKTMQDRAVALPCIDVTVVAKQMSGDRLSERCHLPPCGVVSEPLHQVALEYLALAELLKWHACCELSKL